MNNVGECERNNLTEKAFETLINKGFHGKTKSCSSLYIISDKHCREVQNVKIITRDKKELSMEECTELLQISKTSVQNLIKKGELEAVYHNLGTGTGGRVRRITLSSVSRYTKNKIQGGNNNE